MGQCFSDAVEQALRYIYYDVTAGRGAEGFQLLEQASASGDGDASCILARCLCGRQYVWSGHGFPEDEQRARELLVRSAERGSAIGVLVALRSGELTQSMLRRMPFRNLREAFDVVLQKAEQGEPFCQYTVGNVYFWWDFLTIQEKDRDSFPSREAFKDYMKENVSKCESWFQKAFQGGVHYAGNNLRQYYLKGDEDIIPPQPEKAKGIWRTGAQLGYPVHQYAYAQELWETGKREEALQWYQKAAGNGQLDAWYELGMAYELGEGVSKDCRHAVQCYEKGLAPNAGPECANRLGALYFEGKEVPQDYDKAFRLLMAASDKGSNWGVFYLGKAYFYGLGTQRDYAKARAFLEKVDWVNHETDYMLGLIYGQGLGVAEDIKKGVEYLKKAGDRQDAKEELGRYKKTLWGKWVRR